MFSRGYIGRKIFPRNHFKRINSGILFCLDSRVALGLLNFCSIVLVWGNWTGNHLHGFFEDDCHQCALCI